MPKKNASTIAEPDLPHPLMAGRLTSSPTLGADGTGAGAGNNNNGFGSARLPPGSDPRAKGQGAGPRPAQGGAAPDGASAGGAGGDADALLLNPFAGVFNTFWSNVKDGQGTGSTATKAALVPFAVARGLVMASTQVVTQSVRTVGGAGELSWGC